MATCDELASLWLHKFPSALASLTRDAVHHVRNAVDGLRWDERRDLSTLLHRGTVEQ